MTYLHLDVTTEPDDGVVRLRLCDDAGRHLDGHAVRLGDHPPAMWEGLFDTRSRVRRYAGGVRTAASDRMRPSRRCERAHRDGYVRPDAVNRRIGPDASARAMSALFGALPPVLSSRQEVGVPAKDRYHDAFKAALVRDGWTITHDPLTLRWGKKDMFVDLGAEKLLAAEKGERKIAVEVKSFLGRSELRDLQQALGQYTMYRRILELKEPDRKLYLAIRELVYNELFEEPIGQLLIESEMVQIVVFSEETEEVLRWIP